MNEKKPFSISRWLLERLPRPIALSIVWVLWLFAIPLVAVLFLAVTTWESAGAVWECAQYNARDVLRVIRRSLPSAPWSKAEERS